MRVGRVRLAVAHDRPIDHAVAVEEHRGSGCHRVDSHFVGAALRRGCDTSRCQTTAWNASVCGVMVSGLTVGTITHASATCAV